MGLQTTFVGILLAKALVPILKTKDMHLAVEDSNEIKYTEPVGLGQVTQKEQDKLNAKPQTRMHEHSNNK